MFRKTIILFSGNIGFSRIQIQWNVSRVQFNRERIIVQNGNAYLEGIEPQWYEIRDYWEHPAEEKKQRCMPF